MRKVLFAAAATVALSGCLYRQPVYQGNLMNKTRVDQLQVGQSKQQVADLLGLPSIQDPFHHDRWDYTATQRVGRTGQTQVKNFTVTFANNTVSKWEGDSFADQDEALARSSVRTFGRNLTRDKDKKRRGGGGE